MDRFCVELAVFVVCELHLEIDNQRLRFYPIEGGLSNIWEGDRRRSKLHPCCQLSTFFPTKATLLTCKPAPNHEGSCRRFATLDLEILRALGMNSEARTNRRSATAHRDCGMHFARLISLKSHPPSGQAHQVLIQSLEVCLWEDKPRIGRVDRVCQTQTLLELCRGRGGNSKRPPDSTYNFLYHQGDSLNLQAGSKP